MREVKGGEGSFVSLLTDLKCSLYVVTGCVFSETRWGNTVELLKKESAEAASLTFTLHYGMTWPFDPAPPSSA